MAAKRPRKYSPNPKGKTTRHATKHELRQRVDAVYLLMLRGVNSTQILQSITTEWSLSERQAYNYLHKAQERLEEEAKIFREHALAEHIALRRQLRRDAMDKDDSRFVLDVLKDEARLIGLYAPDKVAPTTPDGKDSVPMTPPIAIYLPQKDPPPTDLSTPLPPTPWLDDDDNDNASSNQGSGSA